MRVIQRVYVRHGISLFQCVLIDRRVKEWGNFHDVREFYVGDICGGNLFIGEIYGCDCDVQ